MVIHLCIHTGEHLYTCQQYGKCFSQEDNMVDHQRHTQERNHLLADNVESNFLKVASRLSFFAHTKKTNGIFANNVEVFSSENRLGWAFLPPQWRSVLTVFNSVGISFFSETPVGNAVEDKCNCPDSSQCCGDQC